MNRISPKKLLNSKWTAVMPENREKHFIVSEAELNEKGRVVSCCMEAVLSRRSYAIDWHELKDETRWVFGWK